MNSMILIHNMLIKCLKLIGYYSYVGWNDCDFAKHFSCPFLFIEIVKLDSNIIISADCDAVSSQTQKTEKRKASFD